MMTKTVQLRSREVVCMICGRPAETSICLCCVARVQGEAIEVKRDIERKGHVETTRH